MITIARYDYPSRGEGHGSGSESLFGYGIPTFQPFVGGGESRGGLDGSGYGLYYGGRSGYGLGAPYAQLNKI